MIRFITVVGVLLATGVFSDAAADTIFFANITGSQENPPATAPTTTTGDPRPLAFGTGTFVLNDPMTALAFTATVFNIDITGTQSSDTNDNLTAAHIHAPAPPGMNAGVRFGFFGAPFNDINPNDVVITPFSTGVGFTVSSKWDAPEGNNTTLAAQLANILAGQAYINFHTVQFGGGEIRGQITPVPEPSTLVLLGLGLAGAARRARRKRSDG